MLSEAEKKLAREYLKVEVKKLKDNEVVAIRETDDNKREEEKDGDNEDKEEDSAVVSTDSY